MSELHYFTYVHLFKLFREII